MQITTYNNILLARNNLAASSSANNPLVRDYDTQLVGMREAIDRAVNAQVVALNKNLSNLGGARENFANSFRPLRRRPNTSSA